MRSGQALTETSESGSPVRVQSRAPDRHDGSMGFTAVLPSTMEAVEGAARDFRRLFGVLSRDVAGHADPDPVFSGELLLREALLNAVLHGNGSEAQQNVYCAARVKRGNLLIVVIDQGQGFDWQAAMARDAAAHECTGRGLRIFRMYATRVRFSARGNRVALLKRASGDWKREQE